MALFELSQYDTPAHQEATAHMRVTLEGGVHSWVDPTWMTRSADEGLNAREFHSWTTREMESGVFLERLGRSADIVATSLYRQAGKVEVLVRVGKALCTLAYQGAGRVWIGSAAALQQEATGAIDFLLTDVFPESKPAEDKPAVAYAVWTEESHFPSRSVMDVTPWASASMNYPLATREQLAALAADDFEAGRDGRLILLYGPPGTGKSNFLATLAYEWRRWGDLQVVADPATVLAAPDYLTRVALSRRREEKWGLVVLEDSGNLFGVDADQRAGEHRLGALLNCGSGILGNASRTLWILTTNAPLREFNAAVSRPGRCAAAIELTPFPPDEARAWFEAKDRPDLASEVRGELTLAELYALLRGNKVEPVAHRPVGFRSVG